LVTLMMAEKFNVEQLLELTQDISSKMQVINMFGEESQLREVFAVSSARIVFAHVLGDLHTLKKILENVLVVPTVKADEEDIILYKPVGASTSIVEPVTVCCHVECQLIRSVKKDPYLSCQKDTAETHIEQVIDVDNFKEYNGDPFNPEKGCYSHPMRIPNQDKEVLANYPLFKDCGPDRFREYDKLRTTNPSKAFVYMLDQFMIAIDYDTKTTQLVGVNFMNRTSVVHKIRQKMIETLRYEGVAMCVEAGGSEITCMNKFRDWSKKLLERASPKYFC